MSQSFVINTPNSNIGRPLTLALLAARQAVTIISRRPETVADLVAHGANLVHGSIDDPATLDVAFAGADTVFWLTPPVYQPGYFAWVDQITALATQRLRHHGVTRAVVVSSMGAQHGPGSGPIGKLLSVEDAFRAAVADVTVLRPAFFMENLLQDLATIAAAGTIFSPLPTDRPMPWVATHDIGLKAAEILLDRSWHGHQVRNIYGAVDLTWREVATILSENLGRPVAYVEVSLDQAKQGMLDAGAPAFLVELIGPMLAFLRDAQADSFDPRTPDATTATTLAEFSRTVLAPALAQVKTPAHAG